MLGDEIGGAAGDVDVLADQVAVDARDEIVGIEVDVFDPGVQLGGDVVAQPFGVHADVQVAQRRNAGAPAFGHFSAAARDDAVHIDRAGLLAAGGCTHGRPDEVGEIDDD